MNFASQWIEIFYNFLYFSSFATGKNPLYRKNRSRLSVPRMSKPVTCRQALLFFPVILLAACAQRPQAPALVETPAAAADVQKPIEVVHPVPQSAMPPATVKISEPSRLKGLTPLEVKEVLGQPGFLRRDAPAEIWQYRGRGCTLDLFIYDLGTGQKVDHWAVRSPARVNDADCFQQLVSQGQPQPGS